LSSFFTEVVAWESLIACLSFFKDTMEPVVQDGAVADPPPESLKSTDHSPMTPQQLLVQGVSKGGSVSAFSWIVVVVIVLFAVYMSRKRRVSDKIDEKYGA
jgi:hypothetical protein